jgi:hypothetical protein
VLIVGIAIGASTSDVFNDKASSASCLTSEEKELDKWKDVQQTRQQQGRAITEKARKVVTVLGQRGSRYERTQDNLSILDASIGFLSPDIISIEIIYKKELVFFVEANRVKVFHPGEWEEKLMAIDIKKEQAAQEIEVLKKAYSE